MSGCDTEAELRKQRLELAHAEEAAMQALAAQLSQPIGLDGSGNVSVFLSSKIINSILAGADGMVVPIEQVKGGTVTIRSMRSDFRMGLPAIRIEAVAQKAGLDASLELVGVARLEPTIEPGSPANLLLRIHVDSIVPRAKWSFFEFKIKGLIHDLMQVQASDRLRTIGVIRVPIETSIPLVLNAKQTPISFTGVNGYLATPEFSLKARAGVDKVLTLPDGIRVYGKVSAVKEST